MIEKRVSQAVLELAMSTGADYAEIYAEDTTYDSIGMVADCVEAVNTSRDRGAGVRVFSGTNSVYAYGNGVDEGSLLSLASKAAAAVNGVKGENKNVVLAERDFGAVCRSVTPVSEVSKADRVNALKEAYFSAKDESPRIVQVRGILNSYVKHVYVANSEGVIGADERPYIRMFIVSVASDGTENQVGNVGPGAGAGFEFIRGLDLKALGKKASATALTMLDAKKCPAGKMPVVMAGGFGGVIFHEACGHSLEATSVGLGNSVFCGKLGQKIAADCVSACDDATMPGEWGSLAMSDEGEKTRRISLIENGVLKGYMIDKLGSRRMDMPSTGSGRRQSYALAPTSRMSNTFICPGKDNIEEMIGGVDLGLYAANMGGGSVNPVTGEFNFSVMEGYMIRNGQIAEPVRGATLIGKGHEILFNIDRVSSDMELGQGMCGSLSGSIPVNVGQPTIRISEITVGGEVK